jgi:hypothetical protein
MRKLVVLVAVMMLFMGCSRRQLIEYQGKIHAPRPQREQPENLDICEAVFRYQFKHNASMVQQNAKAYFIRVFKQDPSDEFLARFTGNIPPVKKGSEFAIGQGLVFCIRSIDRIDENTVQVSGGYYEAELSSSDSVYTVVRRNGRWVVENDEMQWISRGTHTPTRPPAGLKCKTNFARAPGQTGDLLQSATNNSLR